MNLFRYCAPERTVTVNATQQLDQQQMMKIFLLQGNDCFDCFYYDGQNWTLWFFL